MDVPDVALDLFTRFINGVSFADIPLPPEPAEGDFIILACT